MITVIQQGYFTTVQDEGRWGYQAYGMPTSGAMDRYAYHMANLLAGNTSGAALLEMTRDGGAFKFDEEQLVAVCGADMNGTLNGKPVVNWSAFYVPRRGEIRFGSAKKGYRTYLAVRGGIEAPLVLGSRSTYTRAGIGGYEGRTLRPGDVLYTGKEFGIAAGPGKLAAPYIPKYTSTIVLRVLLGPQDDMFSGEAIKTFFKSTFTVSEEPTRTGCQLNGVRILTGGKADIISDAVGVGAILIPSSGYPFIVTADHGTTRGFAKIGYVIQADLMKIAQARPGESVAFELVTEEQAVKAYRDAEQRLTSYADICRQVQKN